MISLKSLLMKLALGYRSDSASYVRYLRAQGFDIGENVTINCPWNFEIDKQRPWMIKIGNNVVFSNHITILQHGYDWCVLKHLYGDVLGSAGKVVIGNNVFVGARSTILKGVTIGDNVIIGGVFSNEGLLRPWGICRCAM